MTGEWRAYFNFLCYCYFEQIK